MEISDDLVEEQSSQIASTDNSATTVKTFKSINKLLENVEKNILAPLRETETPYTDSLQLIENYIKDDCGKIVDTLTPHLVSFNPSVEDEFEAKTFALNVFIRIRGFSFHAFNEIYVLTLTEPSLLIRVQQTVFENIGSKDIHVSQFLKALLYLNSNEEFIMETMKQIFFHYSFGNSVIHRTACSHVEIYTKFIRYIDSLLTRLGPVVQEFAYLKLNQKLIAKKIRSFLSGYSKTGNIRKDVTPNFYIDSQMNAFNHYCYLRHKKEISNDAFIELSKLMCQDPDVERTLLQRLNKSDSERVKRTVVTRPMPASWNLEFSELSRKDRFFYSGKNEYKLEMIFVNSPGSFVCMNKIIVDSAPLVVGFDAEWMPLPSFQTFEIALFQISTRKQCFLIDTIALGRFEEMKSLWEIFLRNLFENIDIIKLGFSCGHDLELLLKMNGSSVSRGFQAVSVIDLNSVNQRFKRFLETYNGQDFQIKRMIERMGKISRIKRISGLNSMVFLLFGKELDKREQISNWEQRPLRREQLIYAALDAYCLVDIYHRLNNLARNNFGYQNFDDFLEHLKQSFNTPQ